MSHKRSKKGDQGDIGIVQLITSIEATCKFVRYISPETFLSLQRTSRLMFEKMEHIKIYESAYRAAGWNLRSEVLRKVGTEAPHEAVDWKKEYMDTFKMRLEIRKKYEELKRNVQYYSEKAINFRDGCPDFEYRNVESRLGLIIPNDLKEFFRVFNGVVNNFKKGRKGKSPYPPLIEVLDLPVRRFELDPEFKEDNFVSLEEGGKKSQEIEKPKTSKNEDEDSDYHDDLQIEDIPYIIVKPKSNFVLLIGEKVQYSICDDEATNLFYDTNVGMGNIKQWLTEEVERIVYDPREYLFEVKLETISSLPTKDAFEELNLLSDEDKKQWRELILQEIERVSNMEVVSTYNQTEDTISIWKDAAELLELETQNFLVEVFQIAGIYSDKRGSEVINELDFHRAAEELSLIFKRKDGKRERTK